ncbi:hypothetical protein QYE76_031956 [Lolium multiflorum]|uniref:Integrase catalytic domain-containing protein n=1 Tax=Lolium multiflorum TaxID=4521 RepID=A0AAD8VKW0_LOLMU|nr:hypothetical protein QYE76_031956 [Lolium multiflorum]
MTHLLVMIDKFTKWIEAKPIKKLDGSTAITFLKEIIVRYGYPHSIITDNGSNFAEGIFKRYCGEMGIRMDLSSVAHPETNGQVEKANGLILAGIRPRLVEPLERASNELWRIILEGFKPYNPDKLTRREAVDSQLNNTALHMIQTSVGTQELPRVRNYTTAKEAWDGLAASCIGSESTIRNKYNALRNQAEGFMRLPDEDHQVMYGRLLIVADADGV